MAWLWTDDIARLLIELDGVDPAQLIGLTERPVGVWVDDTDPSMAAGQTVAGDAEAPGSNHR
jgi:hypothetical protein